jgi:hypothetical protein
MVTTVSKMKGTKKLSTIMPKNGTLCTPNLMLAQVLVVAGQKRAKMNLFLWVAQVQAGCKHVQTPAMEDLILKALHLQYSIQANNPQVEDLSQRLTIAEEVDETSTGMLLLVLAYLVVMKPTMEPILLVTKHRRVTMVLMSTRIVMTVRTTNLKMKTKMHKY